MNKDEVERFILENISNIKKIYCMIWEGYDENNNISSWLDVYIECSSYKSIFISNYFKVGSKELDILQNKWYKKLLGWINPIWGIEVVKDRKTI